MKYITTLLLFLFLSGAAVAQNIDNGLLLDYYQNQKFKDAYSYLKTTYTGPITDTKALANLAYTAKMSGNLADAEGFYLQLFNKDSTNVSILFNLGNVNISRGNKVKAITYYTKILQRDSSNFSVYRQLANLYETQYDTLNYGKYLVKANSIDPTDPDVAYDLGRFYIALKKYDKAVVTFDKAIKADTLNLILLKGRAEVSFLQKKYPETVKACVKLIDNGEKNAYVINWLAISYFNLRQYQKSLITFQMLSGDMLNESSFFYIAMCYKGLDDQPNAIIYLQKALVDAISPNVANYYEDMGDSYVSLHKPKKALAAYQKGLQFKEIPLIYYAIASLYDTDLKDTKTAVRYYKKYLAAKPNEKDDQKYIEYAKSRIPALGGNLLTIH